MGSQGSSRTWCRVGCWGISEEQMQRGSTAGVVCQGAWVTVGAPADIPPWRVVRYLTSSGMKLLHCRVLGVGAEKRTLLTATTVLGGCHRAGSCRATGGHWGHGAPAQMARGGVSGGRSTQQSSELVLPGLGFPGGPELNSNMGCQKMKSEADGKETCT